MSKRPTAREGRSEKSMAESSVPSSYTRLDKNRRKKQGKPKDSQMKLLPKVPPPYPYRKFISEFHQKNESESPIEKERYIDSLIEEELIRRSLNSELNDNIEDIESGISVEDLIQKHRDPLKTLPTGALSFHLLDLKVHIKNRFYSNKGPYYFYFFMTNNRTRRVSKPIPSLDKKKIRFDSTVHFTIELPDQREYFENQLEIELWAFRSPEVHFLVGRNSINLYDLIIMQSGFNTLRLWKEGIEQISVGRLTYEYAFAYGSMGYCHSTQLDNSDLPPYSVAKRSLFPRLFVKDGPGKEPEFGTYLPERMKNIGSNSLIWDIPKQGVTRKDGSVIPPEMLAKPKELKALQVEFDRGEPYYIHVKMEVEQKELQAELNDTYGDLLCITNRGERLFYLEQMLNGRKEDVEEDIYATPLFDDLTDLDIDYILDAKDDPGQIIFPRPDPNCDRVDLEHHLHLEKKEVNIDKELEAILDRFPSAPRTQGYLGRLFGFGDPTAGGHVGEPDYPLDEINPNANVKRHRLRSICRWISVYLNPFALLYWLFIFTFPDLNTQPKKDEFIIPEISVTLPSPSGSTTDLHALWMPEQMYQREEIDWDHLPKKEFTTKAMREAYEVTHEEELSN